MPFNEIGLREHARVDGAVCDGHMRCAKRSSAALRTAVALEEAADAQEVEAEPTLPEEALPVDLRPVSIVEAAAGASANSVRDTASELAKLRRDIKNCYEQRDKAVACGDMPLVRVPVLGRAVRLFGDWYALCVCCGCLAKLAPGARFGSEPCCMRCDFAMLHGGRQPTAPEKPKASALQCRFCGKQQGENGAVRWKTMPAGRLHRPECQRAAAAARGFVLPAPLPSLVRQCAPRAALLRDLCAHHRTRAADDWRDEPPPRRCRDWRANTASGAGRRRPERARGGGAAAARGAASPRSQAGRRRRSPAPGRRPEQNASAPTPKWRTHKTREAASNSVVGTTQDSERTKFF